MKTVCVFAGSRSGTNPAFSLHAKLLGEEIVKNGLTLVYGGSSVGLMGDVAAKVLELGGRVVGVMPSGLFGQEVVHRGLSEFIEVKDMHERKATMGELADAFIALPGGFGTYEELFEVVSWAQIGIHQKPVGLLNVSGYYDPLLAMVDHAVQSGFVREQSRRLLIVEADAQELLKSIQA